MKDAFWFQHDSNARTDARILELRAEMGWEGYGLWWALVEKLREATDYHLSNVLIGGLAMDLALSKSEARGFLDTCIAVGLLAVEGDCFHAPALRRRMERWDTKRSALSEAGRRGAGKRWAGDKPPDSHPISQAIDTPLARPIAIREEKSKVEQPLSDSATPSPDGAGFEIFWQAYGRKEGAKGKMAKQWNGLKLAARQLILNGLPAYKQAKTANGPQYLPLPQTFLNGKLWEAETYGTIPDASQPAIRPATPDPETDRLRAYTQAQAQQLAPAFVYNSKPNGPAQVHEPMAAYSPVTTTR